MEIDHEDPANKQQRKIHENKDIPISPSQVHTPVTNTSSGMCSPDPSCTQRNAGQAVIPSPSMEYSISNEKLNQTLDSGSETPSKAELPSDQMLSSSKAMKLVKKNVTQLKRPRGHSRKIKTGRKGRLETPSKANLLSDQMPSSSKAMKLLKINVTQLKRPRGRPRKIKSGRRGRPRKFFSHI